MARGRRAARDAGRGRGAASADPVGSRRRLAWTAVLLVLATAVAYMPVRLNGFVDYDDGVYLTENPHVQQGFTREAFLWAFNVGYAGNWHPLTWLSHVLDVVLFGLAPAGHHLVSAGIHAASAVVLLVLMHRLTDRLGASAFVAAVFALHPLHVESVAWAAERKDVLSALLGLSALLAWVEWKRAGRRMAYAASIGLFALGLLAKPMLVSLPALLVLLDLFPFGTVADRIRADRSSRMRVLVAEKVPFVLLALASALVTYEAQRRGGAVASVEALPVGGRLANAITACAAYLGKAVVPTGLAVFYPHFAGGVPGWKVAVAVAVVAGATALALAQRNRIPALAFGWLGYLVTLLPVIGIVQVGQQAMADRYTYLPLVGISIAAAYGVPRLLGDRLAAATGLVAALAWIPLTRHQVSLWHDDVTLFTHAKEVTEGNYLARYRLAYALGELGRVDEALAEYRASIAIHPRLADPHNNMGKLLERLGRTDEALACYDRAIALDPTLAAPHGNRANVLDAAGRVEEAEASYRKAIGLDPSIPEIHNDFGVALASRGRLEEAERELREAIRLRPGYGDAYLNLAKTLHELGRTDEAIECLREGVRLEPDRADARSALEELLRSQSGG